MKNYIQIAGVHDEADTEILTAAGADAIGFPLRLDVHNPYLSEAAARDIIHSLNGKATPVLITYLDQAKEIMEFCSYLGDRKSVGVGKECRSRWSPYH